MTASSRAIVASLAVHAVLYAWLGEVPRRPLAIAKKSLVTFEVAEQSPPPREPLAPPEAPREAPPPPPNARAAHAPKPLAAEASPTVARTEKPPLLDLTGVTLTGSESSFSMPGGTGNEREGPLGPISAQVTRVAVAAVDPTPRPERAGAPVVAVSDLAARPAPPALEGLLRQNYPDEARRRALSGTASVRARIEPDGVVRRVSLLNESFAGFGEACRRTLVGSHWTPPRDHSGRAVATEVRYTCRFVVTP
jgi:TonB family protein